MVIDRFEGNYAICEYDCGATVDIPRHELPASAREGDVLIKSADGSWKIDERSANAILNSNTERLQALLNRKRGS